MGWAGLSGFPLSLASFVAFSSKPPGRKHWFFRPGLYPALEDCVSELPCRREKKSTKFPCQPQDQGGWASSAQPVTGNEQRVSPAAAAGASEGRCRWDHSFSPGLSQPCSGVPEAAGDGAGVCSAHGHPRPCRVHHQAPLLEEALSCLVKDALNQTALLP